MGSARRAPNPSYHQKTTEVNFNYVIKQFDARVMTFYKNTTLQRGADAIPGRRASACSSRSPRRSISHIREEPMKHRKMLWLETHKEDQ